MVSEYKDNNKTYRCIDRCVKIFAPSLCKTYFYIDVRGDIYDIKTLTLLKNIDERRFKCRVGAISLLLGASCRFIHDKKCASKLEIFENIIVEIE